MSEQPLYVKAMLALSGEKFRVWSCVVWHIGKHPTSRVSQPAIAEELGLSVRYVRDVLKELVKERWLDLDSWNGPGRGKDHVKHYSLPCEEKGNHSSAIEGEKRGTTEHLLPPEKGNHSSPIGGEKGNFGAHKRGTTVPLNTRKRTLRTPPISPPLGEEPGANPRVVIRFDYEMGQFTGTESAMPTWRVAYPQIDIEQETRKAGAWLMGTTDRPKSRFGRFLVNWLRRAEKDATNGHRKKRQTNTGNGQRYDRTFAQRSAIGVAIDT